MPENGPTATETARPDCPLPKVPLTCLPLLRQRCIGSTTQATPAADMRVPYQSPIDHPRPSRHLYSLVTGLVTGSSMQIFTSHLIARAYIRYMSMPNGNPRRQRHWFHAPVNHDLPVDHPHSDNFLSPAIRSRFTQDSSKTHSRLVTDHPFPNYYANVLGANATSQTTTYLTITLPVSRSRRC